MRILAHPNVQPTPRIGSTGDPAAYGYCRVSADQQRDSGINLDEQQRKIEARCLENGWQLERGRDTRQPPRARLLLTTATSSGEAAFRGGVFPPHTMTDKRAVKQKTPAGEPGF
jgi:hypothetical protein